MILVGLSQDHKSDCSCVPCRGATPFVDKFKIGLMASVGFVVGCRLVECQFSTQEERL
jgi:hypothetical protein